MAKKPIYRNVLKFEILSDTPLDGSESLENIAYACDKGDCVGRFIENEVTNEKLEGSEASHKLYVMGSQPEFFNIDNEGNEIED